MKNKEMTKEAKEFISALKFLNHRDGKAEMYQLDEETALIYEIWYKLISTECAKIYTKSKIREVKKQLLAEVEKQITGTSFDFAGALMAETSSANNGPKIN